MSRIEEEGKDFYDYCVKESTVRSNMNSPRYNRRYKLFLMYLKGSSLSDIAKEVGLVNRSIRQHLYIAFRDLYWEYKSANDDLIRLGLSARSYNILKRRGINTIPEAVEFMKKRNGSLADVRNAGKRTEEEIMSKLNLL